MRMRDHLEDHNPNCETVRCFQRGQGCRVDILWGPWTKKSNIAYLFVGGQLALQKVEIVEINIVYQDRSPRVFWPLLSY